MAVVYPGVPELLRAKADEVEQGLDSGAVDAYTGLSGQVRKWRTAGAR
jgi:hypothetical protein